MHASYRFRQIGAVFLAAIHWITATAVSAQPVDGYRFKDLSASAPISSPVVPVMMNGLIVHPDSPLDFDFIFDSGDREPSDFEFTSEIQTLIRYFFTALTVPDTDLWVNLSPYEQSRIMPDRLGQTRLGEVFLRQDFELKTLSSSLLNPEASLGRHFWDRVYERVQAEFPGQDVPVTMLNKVWIVPDYVRQVVDENRILITDSRLKVMLEEDYLATGQSIAHLKAPQNEARIRSASLSVLREVIIPELERDVNESHTFAPLRQVFHSLILAMWYKDSMTDSIISQQYVDQNAVDTFRLKDRDVRQKIYQEYTQAFQNGVFDIVTEDYDPGRQQMVTRLYQSGGIQMNRRQALTTDLSGYRPHGSLVYVRSRAGQVFQSSLSRVTQTLRELIVQRTMRTVTLLSSLTVFLAISLTPVMQMFNLDAVSMFTVSPDSAIEMSDGSSEPTAVNSQQLARELNDFINEQAFLKTRVSVYSNSQGRLYIVIPQAFEKNSEQLSDEAHNVMVWLNRFIDAKGESLNLTSASLTTHRDATGNPDDNFDRSVRSLENLSPLLSAFSIDWETSAAGSAFAGVHPQDIAQQYNGPFAFHGGGLTSGEVEALGPEAQRKITIQLQSEPQPAPLFEAAGVYASAESQSAVPTIKAADNRLTWAAWLNSWQTRVSMILAVIIGGVSLSSAGKRLTDVRQRFRDQLDGVIAQWLGLQVRPGPAQAGYVFLDQGQTAPDGRSVFAGLDASTALLELTPEQSSGQDAYNVDFTSSEDATTPRRDLQSKFVNLKVPAELLNSDGLEEGPFADWTDGEDLSASQLEFKLSVPETDWGFELMDDPIKDDIIRHFMSWFEEMTDIKVSPYLNSGQLENIFVAKMNDLINDHFNKTFPNIADGYPVLPFKLRSQYLSFEAGVEDTVHKAVFPRLVERYQQILWQAAEDFAFAAYISGADLEKLMKNKQATRSIIEQFISQHQDQTSGQSTYRLMFIEFVDEVLAEFINGIEQVLSEMDQGWGPRPFANGDFDPNRLKGLDNDQLIELVNSMDLSATDHQVLDEIADFNQGLDAMYRFMTDTWIPALHTAITQHVLTQYDLNVITVDNVLTVDDDAVGGIDFRRTQMPVAAKRAMLNMSADGFNVKIHIDPRIVDHTVISFDVLTGLIQGSNL
jgi:hypothetical protein